MPSVPSTIGSLLSVGIPGPTLDAETRALLDEIQPGGVILFRRNVGDRTVEQIAELIADLHALPSAPLVSVDHEGGRVMRFGEPFTHFPAAAAIGRTGDPQFAEQVGLAMGLELRSVGIDLTYAPVLDVHSNPDNPVIGDRSFGSDPQLVVQMAMAQMRGLQAAGVMPCGKHFPGHGDTATDSHFELPRVDRTRDELERVETAPFRAAIAAGIPMLMSAHVNYPALDPDHPATLSALILQGLLRDDYGFDGVIASDDLDMRAITDHHSMGDAAVATLLAGVDNLLICQNLEHGKQAAAAIAVALQDGRLTEARLATSVRRLQAMRAGRRRSASPCRLPNPAHRELAERLRAA